MTGAIDPERLDDAEAFEGEHLGEAAFVLIADGSGDLVSERARAHAEACPQCAACIAEQALSASEIQVAFSGLGKAERARLVERQHLAEVAAKVTASSDRTRYAPVGLVEPKVAEAPPANDEPASSKRRGRGGGWWIAAGLLVAGLASVPSLSGLAKGISELRHALLVVVSVSMQAEQALRVASSRMEIVRTSASWAAALTLVGVGLFIARREPRNAAANETKEVEGAR